MHLFYLSLPARTISTISCVVIFALIDGTSKGGIVVAIQDELNVPIRYIGIGEGSTDLKEFNASTFAEALFAEDGGEFSTDEPSAHGKRRRRRREEAGAVA